MTGSVLVNLVQTHHKCEIHDNMFIQRCCSFIIFSFIYFSLKIGCHTSDVNHGQFVKYFYFDNDGKFKIHEPKPQNEQSADMPFVIHPKVDT